MSAEHDRSQPDPYQMLGIDREAAGEEVVRAWRRRARAEHPDSRPDDAAAPARFRALAEAYHLLADPDRRAAYDRASSYRPRPRTPFPDDVPLRAGPVWIQTSPQVPAGGRLADEDAVLAQLVLRFLARWDQLW